MRIKRIRKLFIIEDCCLAQRYFLPRFMRGYGVWLFQILIF